MLYYDVVFILFYFLLLYLLYVLIYVIYCNSVIRYVILCRYVWYIVVCITLFI